MTVYRLTILVLVVISSFRTWSQVAVPTNQITTNQESIPPALLGQLANQQTLVAGRYQVGEELVFSIRMQKYDFGNLFAIAEPAGIMLDFDTFLEFFNFPIEYDQENRVYEGWFIGQENYFNLDLSDMSAPLLTLSDKQIQLDPQRIKFADDVFYVEQGVFDEFFGITFEFDYQRLVATMESRKPLPFFEKLKRQGRDVRTIGSNEAIHPELFRGYEILSPQILDVRLAGNYRANDSLFTGVYGILAARDVGMVHTNLFVSGTNQDMLSNSRLVVSKQSEKADLLGFLGATTVEIGDVQPIRQGLTANRSRGIVLSNRQIFNTIDLNEINITGPIQVGWDAELYRNNILIRQDLAIDTGEYSFLDVILNIGNNEFEIVKYGPQGQVEREFRTKVVNKELIDKQNFTYNLSLTESGKTVFGTENLAESSSNLGYNLSGNIRKTMFGVSTTLGFQSNFGDEINQNSLFGRLSGAVGDNYLYTFSGVVNDNSFASGGVSVRGRLKDHNLNLSYDRTSQGGNEGANLVFDNLQLKVGGDLKLFDNARLSYETQGQFERSDTSEQYRLSGRIGISTRALGVFNALQINDQTINGVNIKSTSGSLNISGGISGIYGRFSTNYLLDEGFEVNSYSANLSYSGFENVSTSLSANYNVPSDYYTITSNLGYTHQDYRFFTRMNYSSVNGWSLGLDLSFSLSGQPLIYGDVYQTNRSIAKSSSLSVRVFEDSNLNGKYEIGEVLLPNVKVKSLQTYTNAVTDLLGIAILVGMTPNRLSDIVIDTDTLPSPMLVPLVEGVSIRFREGLADSLDFPVVMSTEIEGTISIIKGNESFEGARIPLQLINQNNQVVRETMTEYDGYYVVDKVITGKYRIAINPNYLAENNLYEPVVTTADIDAFAEEYTIKDITLQQKQKLEGFVANLGLFNSNLALNLFVTLNKEKLKLFNNGLQAVQSDDKHMLIAYFGGVQEDAQESCQIARQLSMDCVIEPKTHWFMPNL